jgi:hypothetical protein
MMIASRSHVATTSGRTSAGAVRAHPRLRRVDPLKLIRGDVDELAQEALESGPGAEILGRDLTFNCGAHHSQSICDSGQSYETLLRYVATR